jgi:hypothetical protein
MQHATADSASLAACFFGKIAIEVEQEIVESGIGEQRLVQSITLLSKALDDNGESRTQ